MKTPQQQAEDIYFACRNGEFAKFHDIREQLSKLIQAKEERDQLKQQLAESQIQSSENCLAWQHEESKCANLQKQTDGALSAVDLNNQRVVDLLVLKDNLNQQIQQLQSANAKLTKDKARVDWIDSQFELHFNKGWDDDGWKIQRVEGGRSDAEYVTISKDCESLREAIDQAMKGSK